MGMTSIPLGDVPDTAESFMVRMRDGVRLATDVYTPSGVWHQLPAILTRLPYDKTGAYTFVPRIAELYTAHGYVFVAQDVRGRARSEGETFPWVYEFNDGYDTIDWIANQKWSNGVVGMCGDSYYGFTQWAAAASGHSALKAIAPRVTSAAHLTTLSPDEAIVALARVPWFAFVGLDPGMYLANFDWSIRPIRDAFAMATDGRRSTAYEAMLAHPIADPWWMRSLYGSRSPYEAVKIPILHWGGWWDCAKYGQFRDYRRMVARPDVMRNQYLIADAIDHEGFRWSSHVAEGASGGGLDETLTTPEWNVREVLEQLEAGLPFYDHCLKGNAQRPPQVRWMLTGRGWREAEAWPPPEAREEVWYLGDGAAALRGVEGGALSRQADSAAHEVKWIHDPNDLVPDLVADTWEPLGLGLPDESQVEARQDVPTFTSETLGAPVCVSGPVTLIVECWSSFRSMHLFAKLVDVLPSGRALLVTQGGLEVHQADHRSPVAVHLGDTGYCFEEGHRLRLEMASSCHPRFLWHPGNEQNPWDAERGSVCEHAVTVGGSASARLQFAVVSGE